MTSKKIVITGSNSVIDNSLIELFKVEGQFSDRYIDTIGVDIYSKNMGESELQLWFTNTPGFESVRSKFYSNTDGVILVCDPSNDNSVEGLGRSYKEIKTFCEKDVPIILLIKNSNLYYQI